LTPGVIVHPCVDCLAIVFHIGARSCVVVRGITPTNQTWKKNSINWQRKSPFV